MSGTYSCVSGVGEKGRGKGARELNLAVLSSSEEAGKSNILVSSEELSSWADDSCFFSSLSVGLVWLKRAEGQRGC
eukprot:154355-Rhodomonas_salina.1